MRKERQTIFGATLMQQYRASGLNMDVQDVPISRDSATTGLKNKDSLYSRVMYKRPHSPDQNGIS